MYKQVIVVRRDLKMRRGKEIAQGAHASMAFLLEHFQNGTKPSKIEKDWANTGQAKICVRVDSEKELEDLHILAKSLKVKSFIITDSGKTEFNGVPTKTVLAIGPDHKDVIDIITGNLDLY